MPYRPHQSVRLGRPSIPVERTRSLRHSTEIISVIGQPHQGMQACTRLDDGECLRRFFVEQGLHQRCVLAPLPLNTWYRFWGGDTRGPDVFRGKERRHGRSGGPQKENKVGGEREVAKTEDLAPITSP